MTCDDGPVTDQASIVNAPVDGVAVDEVLEDEAAERVFSFAIVVSAIRCTLTYVIFPFVAPFAGLADWGPWIGVIVGVIAIASNVISIKRMWASDHRWKKPVSVVNVAMIGLVVALVADDAISLLS